MRVTALAPYPETGPSTRYRIAQFQAPLGERGIDLALAPFVDSSRYESLRNGGALRRVRALVRGLRARRRWLADPGPVDRILVHREIAPVAGKGLLEALRGLGAPLIYDFDDAVYLPSPGHGPLTTWLKDPLATTEALCRSAALVLAGNDVLAEFAIGARGSERGVIVLPTVVDTQRFAPGGTGRPSGRDGPIVGWIGSHSSLPYLEAVLPELLAAARSVGGRVRVVCDRAPGPGPAPDATLEFEPWDGSREVDQIRAFDVGVYPLTDDPWARGKCGFKAIQYLACGVPCIASPVGVLKGIVRDGRTGLVAPGAGSWRAGIEALSEDAHLARALAARGRAHVERHFSVDAVVDRLADHLRESV